MGGWNSLEKVAQDLRYALRMLRRSPGFTSVALLSLALGIGANTAIFSLLNAVMLRALPVQEPGRLVLFGRGHAIGIMNGFPDGPRELYSYPFYRELQRKNQVFEGITAIMSLPNAVHAIAAGSSQAERMDTRLVSGTYFTVLGVKAIEGRVFTDADDQTPGGHPVAVVSYAWWKRRFTGDPGAIGKTLTIGSTVYTIIGVAPPEFFGTSVGETPDAWIPLAMQEQLPPGWGGSKARGDYLLQSHYLIARLKPGVSARQAQAQINLLFKQSLREFAGPGASPRTLDDIQRAMIELTPGGSGVSFLRLQFSGPLVLLMVTVGTVLLIACANIANLLLARAAGRQKEIAVRIAIGAGRMRLLRQMLTESILLSTLGALAGIAFAGWASQLLLWMVSTGDQIIPIHVDPDARVLTFTLLLSLATGLLFGMAPALRGTRLDLNSSLREGRGLSAAQSTSGLARVLIVSQVALSVVLLIGAGLFVRSLMNLQKVDTGFHVQNVLQLRLDTDSVGYKDDDPRLATLYQQVEQRVEAVPGVRSASFSMFTFNQGEWSTLDFPHGHTPPPENQRTVYHNIIGPDYFNAMGLPVILGRGFNSRDTRSSPKVAVINETMARRFFPNESPVGQRFGVASPEHSNDIEIIGVVKDAKYDSLYENPHPADYFPYTQQGQYLADFEVRIEGDPRSVVPEIRRAIGQVNSALPVTEVKTLSQQVDESLVQQRLVANLSAFFGLVALMLASIGIYGVLSYSVARRTNEVGIRMALGARPANVLWLVMREVLTMVVAGLAMGVPVAIGMERLMASVLFGLGTVDPVSVSLAVALLIVVGGLAAYLPARRASRVDPMTALRYE